MRHIIQKVVCLLAVCLITAGSAGPALASGTYRTSTRVNFRADASLQSKVLRTLDSGVSVEVLEYNPDGWSKVNIDGKEGYIKSEYLTVQSEPGAAATPYTTTARVNLRNSPSLSAGVIRQIDAGTAVNVLEYDPANWSKVDVNGTVGYISSGYLAPASAQTSAQAAVNPEPLSSEASEVYRTNTRVNFRTEPSLESVVIKALNAGTRVNVIEYVKAGWSKADVNGTVGYIKSEYLSVAGSDSVELLEWSSVKTILKLHAPLQVLDIRSGITYTVQSFSNGQHADVEPLTKEDTALLKQTNGGNWNWNVRPVWVIIGSRTIAASINCMPHGGGVISGNGMDGQVCLHFLGSTTHNGNTAFGKLHQDGVMEAWNSR